MAKPAPFITSAANADFQPRFEYGHMAQAAVVTNADHDTALGTGFGRLKDAEIPWTIKYDEVIYVIEGQLTVRTGGTDLIVDAGACIWLPKGTELVYLAENALIFYAIHPANWAEG